MTDAGQARLTRGIAEVYEELFVPALLRGWAVCVADAARIEPGRRVLDVACGTGVLAREAAARAGAAGRVVGLDQSEEMLAVARRVAPGIEWRRGAAEALPFEDGSFDAVVSQFGLMFFADRLAAIREMMRVLRPGGRLAVAVWDALENTEGYPELTALVARLFGDAAAAGLRAPFRLGDPRALASLFAEAGVPGAQVATLAGTARFPSLDAWLFTEVKGWVLADEVSDAEFQRLRREAEKVLGRFAAGDGTVVLEAPAHVVTAAKGMIES
ncbi:MAG TPA: methyltransferase domain-containing protein [Longimicrobium sp.]